MGPFMNVYYLVFITMSVTQNAVCNCEIKSILSYLHYKAGNMLPHPASTLLLLSITKNVLHKQYKHHRNQVSETEATSIANVLFHRLTTHTQTHIHTQIHKHTHTNKLLTLQVLRSQCL